jgi:putative FmdB family regulatory protein
MPIYEYECSSCQHRFERRQRFDEEAVANCPQCQAKARRVLHSVPIIFKGSGFYTTDNRKEPKAEPEKAKDEPSGAKDEPSGAKDKGAEK